MRESSCSIEGHAECLVDEGYFRMDLDPKRARVLDLEDLHLSLLLAPVDLLLLIRLVCIGL